MQTLKLCINTARHMRGFREEGLSSITKHALEVCLFGTLPGLTVLAVVWPNSGSKSLC